MVWIEKWLVVLYIFLKKNNFERKVIFCFFKDMIVDVLKVYLIFYFINVVIIVI